MTSLFAAGGADAECAAVADDVGAAVGDRGQFRRAERALQEGSFRGRERARPSRRVNRGSKSKHASHHRECRRSSERGAIGATSAGEVCGSAGIYQFHYNRIWPHASERAAEKVLIYRKRDDAFRANQAGANSSSPLSTQARHSSPSRWFFR